MGRQHSSRWQTCQVVFEVESLHLCLQETERACGFETSKPVSSDEPAPTRPHLLDHSSITISWGPAIQTSKSVGGARTYFNHHNLWFWISTPSQILKIPKGCTWAAQLSASLLPLFQISLWMLSPYLESGKGRKFSWYYVVRGFGFFSYCCLLSVPVTSAVLWHLLRSLIAS